MPSAEARILSVLRPGDMVRFSAQFDAARRVVFHIEGAPRADGDACLEERLILAIGQLRKHGFLFDNTERPTRRKAASLTTTSGRKHARWVEIQPRSTRFSLYMADLGFNASSTSDGLQAVRIPDLPATLDNHAQSDSLMDLARRVPEIRHLEVEFTRIELRAGAANVLQDLLKQYIKANSVVADALEKPTATEAFLRMWISMGWGWKVMLRASLAKQKTLPKAVLELIGRDFYHCECELHVDAIRAPESGDTLDMSDWFPTGWQFPSALPGLSFNDTSIKARRFHNMSLPDLPKKGLVIGVADGVKVRLPSAYRDRHTYIAGATGTGKSTLLARMIREDIRAGEGVILLDPHGDLHAETLDSVPQARRKDLLVIDPLHEDICPGMNILDLPFDALRKRHAELLIGELITSFKSMWDTPEAFGPMFELYFRNALTLLIMQSGEPCSLADFTRLFADREFRKNRVNACTDSATKTFWGDIAERASGESSLENIAPYIICKVSPLIQGAFLSSILTQPKDDLRLPERINQAPIVLVNLNKGLLGVHESRILGVILMVQIMSAGLKRSVIPRRERHPVNVYVDEFQDFVSDNMASMLSEARKFGLRLTLANQTLAQLRANRGRQDLLETVLGNVGNLIFFRLGVPDAERLKLFLEPFSRQDVQDLPNFHAMVRLLAPEGPIRPLVMKTLASDR